MSILKRAFNPVGSCVSTFLLGSVLLVGASLAFAQTTPTPPSLGTAANFTVLSATPTGVAVTCNAVTISPGELGSAGDATSVVGCANTGAAVVAPVLTQVTTDFNSAYNALGSTNCPGAYNLDPSYSGPQTFYPGVYCSSGNVTFKDSTVTLDALGDANAVWIFKVGANSSGALTGSNFSVVMAGGGQPNNVYWWVAQSMTDTAAEFQGSILAGGDITMNGLLGPATAFNGDVLANGTVSLTNFTITGLPVPSSSPSQSKCNQGVGNGAEGCDPGNASQNPFLSISNDESGAVPGSPGRQGGVAGNK